MSRPVERDARVGKAVPDLHFLVRLDSGAVDMVPRSDICFLLPMSGHNILVYHWESIETFEKPN